MKWLVTIAAYVVTMLLTAPAAFFAILLLAGPEANLLPDFLEMLVIALGWIAVLLVPVAAATAVWRRWERRRPSTAGASSGVAGNVASAHKNSR
jgi:hypothetical protein